MNEKTLLEIKDLHVEYHTLDGKAKALNGVNLTIEKGEAIGLVGETGAGKTTLALSILGLLSKEVAKVPKGEIWFDGANLQDKKNKKLLQKLRGNRISMIFQNPLTSLNPVFTIGQQLDEVTLLHVPGATKELAKAKSEEMLRLVGIIPENVYNAFPHELSGGMRQRVMIAMALAAEPRLIIADEPTTALDVTIQAQILDLLQDIKNKIDGSILLITHDLGVIAEMADYVVVMYAGKVIEKGTVLEIFQDPKHPYTIGLQKSKPTMTLDDSTELYNIPGNVPNPINMPNHCYFKERCAMCKQKCSGDYPGMIQVSPTHFVACHLYDKEENNG